jgi:hypothetical protein
LKLKLPGLKPGVSPLLVAAAAAFVLSVASFVYFYDRGMTNVYGDGIAHLNIARKVVDYAGGSLWRRYIQIGSPWLPLQTVLMLPLVWSDKLWRTGVAGSVVSMLSFIVTAVCIFSMARRLYASEPGWRGLGLPLISTGVFVLNPSVLYLQATPMTEALFMAALAAATALLLRWSLNQTRSSLIQAAVAMSVATLSRYEAWPAAALAAVLVILLARGGRRRRLIDSASFLAIVAVGPAYWLWHNWMIYGNALEFLTGPFSARGLYLQNRVNLGWSKVFVGHLLLDAALMLLAVLVCVGPIVVLLAAAGLARLLAVRRAALVPYAPLALLAVPFFFHIISLYRGEIQVFPLRAFGLLNVRYGVPDLLAVSLFVPAAVSIFGRYRSGLAGCLAVGVLVIGQYVYMVSDGVSQIAVYQEGFRNGAHSPAARARSRLAAYLIEHPPGTQVLMHTGALGPVVTAGGLRFSGVIHEGTERWHLILDPARASASNDAVAGIPAHVIPEDVLTVIVQKNDPLDSLIRDDAVLSAELDRDFEEEFSTESIKVLARKQNSKLQIEN